MKKHLIIGILTASQIMAAFVLAQENAIEIVLDDTSLGQSVEAGDAVSAGGVTMTVTNVHATDGGTSGAVDDFGILFGTDTFSADVATLNISFNVDVRITAYQIGAREDVPNGVHLTISGPNGSSGQNPVPVFSGFTGQEITLPIVKGDLPVLKAGLTYTLTHNLLDAEAEDALFNLEAFWVTPVDVSIKADPNGIHIEYVGILQEYSSENGWRDLDPQPPNIWQFTPVVPSKIFRAKRGPTIPAGFALIPAGSFIMGDSFSEGEPDEGPTHTVTLNAFYLQKTEVTKTQWEDVRSWAASNGYLDLPVGGGEGNQPVNEVNWHDVIKWCNARSEKEGLTPVYTVSGEVFRAGSGDPIADWSADGYRLPTEAEWEKAARGGLTGKRFPLGDEISTSQANYRISDNVDGELVPVAGYAANHYGLHDMAGNVWEWCWDFYDADYYTTSPASDPRGAASGSFRCMRGGCWYDEFTSRLRCANRGYDNPFELLNDVGFRPARRSGL